MKIVLALLTAIICCASAPGARANPARFEWRTFGGVNVNLTPLFLWWDYAATATNIGSTNISGMYTNEVVDAVSNIWQQLPAKPLPTWCRIQADKSSLVVEGSYWLVDADIQLAPQIWRHAKIYLANPPVTEIQNYNWAAIRLATLQAIRKSESDRLQATNAVQQTYQQDSARLNLLQQAFPYNDRINQMAYNVNDAIDQAATEQERLQNRIARRDQEIKMLTDYLASYPASGFAVDHFAIRTGKLMNGLDVYDLGAAAGLNYTIQ